jgi:hypothetical protein
MRAPRKTQSIPEAPKKEKYFILDKAATEIAGIRLTKDHHKHGIELTASEALSYTASGTISTSNPAEDKKATEAVADSTAKAVEDAGGQSEPTNAAPAEASPKIKR